MEVVEFINKTQRDFLKVMSELGGSERAALSMSEISPRLLEEWKEDPDFKIAFDTAYEHGRGTLEAGAMMGLQRNLSAGKMEAIKLTLQAIDPETWNPAMRLEVDVPQHRFIGFDGKDVVTGEVVDVEEGEFEQVEDGTVGESEADGTPEA